MLFANRTGERMLDAGGTEFRADTTSWDRTVRHGTPIIFISANCTPEGNNGCGLPKKKVGASEKKMCTEAQLKYAYRLHRSTYHACANAIRDSGSNMPQIQACEHTSKTFSISLVTAIDVVEVAIMLHQQSY